jgi:hypothetical protein
LAADGNKNKAQLFNRIKRIIEMKNPPMPSGQIIAACSLSAILIAISIVCFSPSHAQNGKKQAKPTPKQQASSKNYSHYIVIDSNGTKTEYKSVDAMPSGRREAYKRSMQALQDTLARLKNLGPAIEHSMEALDELIEVDVSKSVSDAMANVDWDNIGRQVDSALQEVDWTRIERDVERGLAEAERSLRDPKVKAEIRNAMAQARAEVAIARSNSRRDYDQMMREARRNMEEARRDMERSRIELEAARRELERTKRNLEREKRAAQEY